MKKSRNPLTRREARRLLDRDRPCHDDALGMLLARAADPDASSMKGEHLVVAQFRAATHLGPVPATESSPMSKMTRKITAIPFAALGAGALILSGGGLALAASQGAVDVPFTGHDNRSDKAPAAKATLNPGQVKAASKSPSPSARPTKDAEHTATPAGTPSPSLRGLCKAFQAGALAKSKTSPAFTALTSAAGGPDEVATYCVSLLATPKTKPAHPAKPSAGSVTTPATSPRCSTCGSISWLRPSAPSAASPSC